MSTYDDIIGSEDEITAYLNDYGEDATITPKAGEPLPRKVIVQRNAAEEISGAVSSRSSNIVVQIANHATLGRTSIIEGGDTITISRRLGEMAKTWPLAEIIEQDAGFWHVRIYVNG